MSAYLSRPLVPDPNVPEELCQSSDVKEILWNFRRRHDDNDEDEKKRLTLRQHPHFYRKLPEKYGGTFRREPTETFYRDDRDDRDDRNHQISVLTDNSGQAGRVYLEIPKKKRVFSNVWDAIDTIIFKGSSLPSALSLSLTPCQISLEGSRVKESSVRTSKIHLTYGALKSLRGLGLTPPNSRFRLLRLP